MSDNFEPANMSRYRAVKLQLLGDDDGFVMTQDGANYLALFEDLNGNQCEGRLVERGDIGVFSVEGSEDIAEKGKRYGIIRSTEVTKAGNRTGESEDKTEEEDAVSVLWLCTTRYLEAIIEPDCDRIKPDDKEELIAALDYYGLPENGLFLSDVMTDVPSRSLLTILSVEELAKNFTFDIRFLVHHKGPDGIELVFTKDAL